MQNSCLSLSLSSGHLDKRYLSLYQRSASVPAPEELSLAGRGFATRYICGMKDSECKAAPLYPDSVFHGVHLEDSWRGCA